MGKGISQRRRLKHVNKAVEGNLHKRLLGKAERSAFEPLPSAPKKEDLVDRTPKSLQRMMMLKAASEAPRRFPSKSAPPRPRAQGTAGPRSVSSAPPPSATAAPAAAAPAAAVPLEPPTDRIRSGPDTVGLDLPEAAPVKKLKQSKKDYLNRKKLKKKLGKAAKEDKSLLEKSLQQQGKVRFGEVSDAPLEVNLKRKHWSAQQEEKSSARCKDIFLKQLAEAEQREEARRHGVPLSLVAPPSTKRPSAAARPRVDQEKLRLQVIEAYRAKKKGAHASGANMASLAKLVNAKTA